MKLALLILPILGCSTVNMETRSDSPYAPTNEGNGGRISYLATGIPPVVNARREEAYKQMYERCGGPYRIVAENGVYQGTLQTGQAHAYGNSAYASGTSVAISRQVIDFECERQAARDTGPKRSFSDPDVQERIGRQVNCPGEDVAIQKAEWVSPGKAGYVVAACGTRFSCLDASDVMSCTDTGPSATAAREPIAP